MTIKIEFISTLALLAGLNTPELAADYFSVNVKTWNRWQNANQLKKHQIDALRSRAGYLSAPGWQDFKIQGDFIYTPGGQFAARHEIENLWLYRQIKEHNELEPPVKQYSLF